MFDSHAGHVVASDIDELLNKALQTHKITEPNNRRGYEVLIRTMKTSIFIVENSLSPKPRSLQEEAAYKEGVQVGRDEMQIVGTP